MIVRGPEEIEFFTRFEPAMKRAGNRTSLFSFTFNLKLAPCGTLLKFTPPAQLNVFGFLFNRGGMFTPLNLKDIQLGPLTIPLGRSARSS